MTPYWPPNYYPFSAPLILEFTWWLVHVAVLHLTFKVVVTLGRILSRVDVVNGSEDDGEQGVGGAFL
jgi:hypothetical protein